MKKHFTLLVVSFAALWLAPQTIFSQTQKANWKEMHDFHEVMSTTFHPAEEGNLAPLREKAGMLVERAEAWRKSAVPAGYIPEKTADTLKRLVKQCKNVRKSVKKGKPDAELVAAITTAHDIFHEIMEKCRE
ncbi:MAG: hypothetical protein IPM81_22105 [Saprospirales bacterium]|jgi:hypothetical protein|nr:hypothetical protein [Saprospirales bacterium]